MVTPETERRKNLVIIAVAGEYDVIMKNLFERYVIASQQEECERLGKVIKINILEMGKQFPGVAKHYDNAFNKLKADVDYRDR